MRFQVSLALLFGALSACEPPLPEGAYIPRTGMGGGPGASDYDASTSDASIMVTIPPIPHSDAAVVPGTMGGAGGTTDGGSAGGGDAGGQASPAAKRLEPLLGRYLMRMDMLSTTSAQVEIIGTVSTRNRISHLSVTELFLDGDTIIANEQLCLQTFEHVCVTGCKSVSTQMSTRGIDKMVELGHSVIQRRYSFAGNQLTTDGPQQLLGFDSHADRQLPTALTESRVWEFDSSHMGGEGIQLDLRASDKLGLKNVSCSTYNVQTFTATFDGPAGTADVLSLSGRSFKLHPVNDIKTLGFSSNDCKPGAAGDDTPGTQTVRFAQLTADEFPGNALWACPRTSSAWDTKLPPPSP